MTYAAACTTSGPVRKTNEDGFVSEPELGLFAVADGMGGHNAGEVASRLALEALVGFIRRSHEDTDFSWPCGIDPALSYQSNRLRTAISLANRRVFRAAAGHEEFTGMGSTLVSVFFDQASVTIGHMGDSRAYRIRGQAIEQLTVDDTWAMAMLASDPTMDPARVATHPMRHVLTNVLGTRETAEIHISEQPSESGDVYVLCSDGLHGVLEAGDIQRMAGGLSAADVQRVADALVAEAVTRGTRDNVTALVAVRG